MGVIEIALILGGVAVAYYANLANAAGNLIFYPGSIQGLSFQDATPVVQGSVIIQNTSNATFTFNSVAGNITTNGTLVGNISNFVPVTIGPNSQGELPITIKLSLIGVANDVIDAIQSRNISKKIILDGRVNANGVQVPLNLEYSIGL